MKVKSDKEYLEAFGNQVKLIRTQMGYTQEKLAFEANIELRQLGRIERGEINTGILSVKLLSEILKVDQTEFFNFD